MNNRKLAEEVRNNVHLNYKQRQLIFGTLLGDGSMFSKDNGARGVQFAHCEKQIAYLEWKKRTLYPYILAENPSRYTGCCMYRTIVHQDFTDIYGLLFRKKNGESKKFITRKFLNNIDEFGLLVWYMDDGTISKDKDARLATNSESLSEQRSIKKWLWQRFGIETIISLNKSNNSYFLRLSTLNTKKMMRLFLPFAKEIPLSMFYKFKYHFNLNDYTLNHYALTNADGRYSLNTMETL